MKKKIQIGLALVLLSWPFLLASCSKGRQKYPPADHSAYDVSYAKGYGGEEKLKLDVHWPEAMALTSSDRNDTRKSLFTKGCRTKTTPAFSRFTSQSG